MTAEEQRLLAVARAITERSAVDWADAESSAADGSIRETLRELRVIAQIAALHGSSRQPDSVKHWGPLALLEHVGHGSFGDVYRALDTRLDREVALKLMRQPEAEREPLAASVIEEGRLLARVRHPNVVTIYGADRIDGQVGLWMEFVRGRTLEELLQAHGPLPSDDVMNIGRDICRALAAVHAAGLLHRDIKAQNVVQEPGGRLVLMDFGAGRDAGAADAETLAGTPLYLAPEVLEGRPASVQSDIYSIGVLLYHLLTGAYPATGRSVREIREMHRATRRALLGPAVSSALAAVVDRALAPNPTDRYKLASDMAAALEATEAVAAVQPRRGRARALAAAVLATILTGVFLATWPQLRSNKQVHGEAPELPAARSSVALGEPAVTGPEQPCYGCGDEGGSIDSSGRWMAVTDRSGFDPHRLVVRDLTRTTRSDTVLGSAPRGTDFYPVLSSDSRKVAFASRSREGRSQLQVTANARGAKSTVVVANGQYLNITPAAWSSDERSILATIERPDHTTEIVWVTVADGSIHKIKHLGWRLRGVRGRPSLSPDGRYVAYAALATEPSSWSAPLDSTDQHIYVLAPDRPGRERAVAEGKGINEFPIWDGKNAVLFISNLSGTWDIRKVPIRDGHSAGDPTELWRDLGCRCIALHRVLSTGRLYYTKAPPVQEKTEVIEMEPPGQRVKGAFRVSKSFSGSLPAWSPDGRSIATKTMSAKALAEGRVRTPFSSDFETTVYSPDGTKLYSQGVRRTPVVWVDNSAFLETVRDEREVDSLHRVELRTTVRRRVFDYDPSIFTSTMAVFAQPLPAGNELYVFREGPQDQRRQLIALDLETGRIKRTVFELSKGSGESLKLSPDGRMLAFVASDNSSTFVGRVDVNGRNFVELYSTTNRREAEVIAAPAWTSDSGGILFVLEEPLSVYDLPVNAPLGAESRGSRSVNVLTRQSVMYVDADGANPPSPSGVVVERRGRLQGISLKRDGSQLAYGVATGAPELWVLDLARSSRPQK